MSICLETYMNPRRPRLEAATFEYQLVKRQPAVEYHLKEPRVVDIVARCDVGGLALHVLACRGAADSLVELRTAVAAGDGYRLTPHLTQWVEHVIDKCRDVALYIFGHTVVYAASFGCLGALKLGKGEELHAAPPSSVRQA